MENVGEGARIFKGSQLSTKELSPEDLKNLDVTNHHYSQYVFEKSGLVTLKNLGPLDVLSGVTVLPGHSW